MGLLGGAIIGASWLGGIAFGLYAWIVWGLLGIIGAATADPVNIAGLAMGIIWVLFLAKLIAAVIVWGGTAIGGILVAASR